MFGWFKKNKNVEDEQLNKTENVEKPVEKQKEIKIANNYEVKDNGNISIKFEHSTHNGYGWARYERSISKESILSHTKNNIACKHFEYFYNHENPWCVSTVPWADVKDIVEYKENLIKYKEEQIQTLEYYPEERLWRVANVDTIGKEVVYEKTPLEVFVESFEGKYKLIETEDEFNDYVSSSLDCNTWCRMKLYNKMKELGLGDGFINSFADLVGNDLEKYHAMIDLASEVTDKDTLMYLYTYKFK